MARRKDSTYKFYLRNYDYGTSRSIEVRRPSKVKDNYTGEYLIDTALVASSIKCADTRQCKGKQGSGELVIDNACEKHQPIILSIILSDVDINIIKQAWTIHRNAIMKVADALEDVASDMNWRKHKEETYGSLTIPTDEELLAAIKKEMLGEHI